jgi:hypothetical protein
MWLSAHLGFLIRSTQTLQRALIRNGDQWQPEQDCRPPDIIAPIGNIMAAHLFEAT